MKKRTVYTLILSFVLALVNAQDYSPFVLHQTSFYQSKTDVADEFQVEVISFDTIIQTQDYEVGFFNLNSDIPISCFRKMKVDKRWTSYSTDSICWFADSVTIFKGNRNFSLKNNLKIGSTWFCDNNKLSVKSIEYRSFLGLEDSVMLININSTEGHDLLLSKHYGLLNLIPFQDSGKMEENKLQVIGGIQNAEVSKGFQKPNFDDVFNAQMDDVIFRKNVAYSYDTLYPSLTKFIKDSITSVDTSQESITYNYQRQVYQYHKPIIISNESATYNRKFYEKLLSINTNGLFFIEDDYDFLNLMSPLKVQIQQKDTVYFIPYDFTGLRLNTQNCSLDFRLDVGNLNILNTKHGLYMWDAYSAFPPAYEIVIGSIINGNAEGVTRLPTSTQHLRNIEFEVYPNPSNGYINFISQETTPISVSVFNTSGKMLFQSSLFSDQTQLNLSELNNGLYYLKIFQGDKVYNYPLILSN